MEGVLPPRMPLPFMGPFILPLIGGRGGAEDNRGGGAAPCGRFADGGGTAGRCWLTMLQWWSNAYKVSMRGTRTPASWASLIGDPR